MLRDGTYKREGLKDISRPCQGGGPNKVEWQPGGPSWSGE